MNLEEIKKRAEEYKSSNLNWLRGAADTILQLVAEIERLSAVYTHREVILLERENKKLTNANKILRDRINNAMAFDSHYPMKDLLNAGLAEADEVLK